MKLHWFAVTLFAGAGSVQAQSTERVSVDSAGGAASGDSFRAAISADGRCVAFCSYAPYLVAGDTNNKVDIFVHDRQSGATERVSVDSAGAQAGDSSVWPSISGDGRFIAFTSDAMNLIALDINLKRDIFVRDRLLGTTERVSVDSAGLEANGESTCSSISADGRFVAFCSWASNLVPGDNNMNLDVFVRDRLAATTERVSLSSTGTQTNGASWAVCISGDGRFVAFGSFAINLVAGDTNGSTDIFVRDRLSGTTERVSVDSSGAEANGNSGGVGDPARNPAISADGRFVAFYSVASNLVAGDTNGCADIFVHDRLTGTTERVSVDTAGVEGNLESFSATISADGRYVGFESWATNLVAGDTNNRVDVFVRDRLSGTTERDSVDTNGLQGGDNSRWPSLSADGRCLAFESRAVNLVASDTNGVSDIFERERGGPPIFSFCTPGQAGVIACPCSNPPAGPDRGCDNSSATGGATLVFSGNSSLAADTLVFTTAGERPTATSIVLQGASASASGVVFGQGVRCVTGLLKRLYLKGATGGSIIAPSGADPGVSVRSAALGDTIIAGQQRYYLVYYRDPVVLGGCSATSTFNATDALDATWSP